MVLGDKFDMRRWFTVWIGFGLSLAVLLLVNSVMNYVMVSKRIVVEQLRRDLAADVVAVDHQLQTARLRTPEQLAAMLDQARIKSNGRVAWIQFRDGNDGVLAQAGLDAGPTFAAAFVRAKFRSRQPAYKTLRTSGGQVIVEAFPVRVPPAAQTVSVQLAANGGVAKGPRQAGIVEIAGYLEGSGGSLWPLTRSLMINSAAAMMLVVSLVVVRLRFRSYMEGQQLEREVSVARRVQRDLLPPAGQAVERFELAADYLPAEHLGGDFYDTFAGRFGSSAFLVGDVSGKGVPAAMLTGLIQGAARASSWTESARQHEEASVQLNRLLCERASSERFVTMFWGYFEPDTQLLRYINAGHCSPLLFKARHPGAALRLTEGGPLLGLLRQARYVQHEVRMDPGDVLVLYSDGLVETRRGEDEQYGEDRLIAAVERNFSGSVEQVRDAILSDAKAFSGECALDDDRTLLVIRYQPTYLHTEELILA